MDDRPKQSKRRWFQFRLSTWLILIAILAWAMEIKSAANLHIYPRSAGAQPGPRAEIPDEFQLRIGIIQRFTVSYRAWGLGASFSPKLVWPATSLLLLIAWRMTWKLLSDHRYQRRTESQTNRNKTRRWFQFKLSTWLALFAIMSWSMAIRPQPHMELMSEVGANGGGNSHGFEPRPLVTSELIQRCLVVQEHGGAFKSAWKLDTQITPRIIWPAIALLLLFNWKIAWLLIERRRQRVAHKAAA